MSGLWSASLPEGCRGRSSMRAPHVEVVVEVSGMPSWASCCGFAAISAVPAMLWLFVLVNRREWVTDDERAP